jgi:3-isopropylmalate/(R)-2-methylmalate dehydratase small subunit
MSSSGRAFVFGDRIDTDVLAPGALMKLAPEDLAKHCLKAVRPDFAQSVQPGDFVVAGEGFGIGSSREQAAVSLRLLGVRAVLAKSFARIFYRNAFNIGLPALVFEQSHDVSDGDDLSLDLAAGALCNQTSGHTYTLAAVPDHLLAMAQAGGLVAQLRQRFAARGTNDAHG